MDQACYSKSNRCLIGLGNLGDSECHRYSGMLSIAFSPDDLSPSLHLSVVSILWLVCIHYIQRLQVNWRRSERGGRKCYNGLVCLWLTNKNTSSKLIFNIYF